MIAFVWTDSCGIKQKFSVTTRTLPYSKRLTCMGTCVAFQIKGIIETFATEGTEIALDIRVTFEMSIEKTSQIELFTADLTFEWIIACCSGLTRTVCTWTDQLVSCGHVLNWTMLSASIA